MKFFQRRFVRSALFGLLGGAVLIGGLSACGHHGHDYGAAMTTEQFAQQRDKVVDRAASKLDLNADQSQRLRKLGDVLYAQRTTLMGQATNPRAEFKALFAGEKFDAVRAQTLVTEKTAAVQTHSPEVIAAMGDFYNSLTPVQQQKVRDYMDGKHGWFHRG
jgi:Spy/CpxP family protein refolding chaperone